MLKNKWLGGSPCLTAKNISEGSDKHVPTLTCPTVLVYKDCMTSNILPLTPYASSFARRPFLQTVSNAFQKSTK